MRRRLTPVLVLAACVLGACGEDERMRIPANSKQTVKPPTPQVLAFAGDHHVGVLEGTRVRLVARAGAKDQFAGLQWSADGRRLGWLTRNTDDYSVGLRVIDVASGEQHRFQVTEGALTPGLTGITVRDQSGGFSEYLPDGTSVRHAVSIPLGPREKRAIRRYKAKFVTGVSWATPFGGSWLLLASLDEFGTEGYTEQQLLRYTPSRETVSPVRGNPRRRMAFASPLAVDGDQIAWAGEGLTELGSPCDGPSDRINAPDGELPPFPDQPGWRWRVYEVAQGKSGLDVIAHRIRVRPGDESVSCENAGPGFQRLTFRDGRWTVVDAGIVSVSAARDGRIAEVTGAPRADDLFAVPEPGVARVTSPAVTLPAGTRKVLFSPSRPTTGTVVTTGDGPALGASARLSARGLGPLRIGMTPLELQRATVSPLRFRVDERGCGTVELRDRGAAERLGTVGHLAGGTLQRLVVTSHDIPVESEEYDEQDLRPGIGEVRPRGPVVGEDVRAGDDMSELFVDFGSPASVKPLSAEGAVRHVYVLGVGVRLVADTDGTGTIRRLDLRAGSWRC